MRAMHGRYHGGRGFDSALDLTVDRHGLVWVTGLTSSADFPFAGDSSSPRGNFDIAVAQFSADLWDLHLSGAFGGSELDAGYGIAIDSGGNAWLVGHTGSSNYPTVNPCKPRRRDP